MAIRGFWQAAQDEPNRVAVIDTKGNEITAGELLAAGNQLVNGLRKLGLKEGDVIATLLPNHHSVLEVLVANMQVGWHIVPINNHLTAAEIAYIVSDSEAKAFISHAEFSAQSVGTLQCLKEDPELSDSHLLTEACLSIGAIDGFADYENFKAEHSSEMPSNRVAGQFMQYTSGTTGKPKGVQRDVFQIDPETMADFMCANLSRFDIELGNNVFLCPCPLYHMAPLGYTYFSLQFEHTIVLLEKWDEEHLLQLIEKHKVTTSLMVPTHFVRLLKLPEELRNKYDLSSLRNVLHAAAPCPKDIKEKMMAWWGEVIYEYYGATEGGGTLATPSEWLRFPGTVGKAWEGAEIRIYSDDENSDEKTILPAGEVGAVYMKLAQDFTYKGDEGKTRANRIDNFFTAGDIGYLNEEGFLFLCDRKIDMIISGGTNIYPAEVEGALFSCDLVRDVAVFGIPNKDWGEEVKAVIELVDGVEANEETRNNINQYCADNLAKFKWPRSIDFTTDMPRDPNGKLYKRKLRDPYWKDHGAAV